ncbi:MAG: transcriptional regulator NrdR, partial [Acetomicrobium sp.]
MRCPRCNHDDSRVIETRAVENGIVIRRRRECPKCGRRFTTYERIERSTVLLVVKKDGRREA